MKMFKIRSVDQILSTFGKTLTELEARIAHDKKQVEKVESDRQQAEADHQRRLTEFGQKETEHKESATRAGRIADKIRALLD